MKIALIGYGKMGKEVEKTALKHNHQIVAIIDADNQNDINSSAFLSADVAIEFSTPENAFDNVIKSLSAGVPVVCGTTGWLDKLEEAKKVCTEKQTAFLYASNFSLGVNILFHINRELARIMERFPQYEISMEEIHHIQKKDAPSGTAISLANDIIQLITRKTKWINESETTSSELAIESVREGSVPGTHTVIYESEADIISISHEAKGRTGLAEGAILATEFLNGKKGIFTMKDVLGI